MRLFPHFLPTQCVNTNFLPAFSIEIVLKEPITGALAHELKVNYYHIFLHHIYIYIYFYIYILHYSYMYIIYIYGMYIVLVTATI